MAYGMAQVMDASTRRGHRNCLVSRLRRPNGAQEPTCPYAVPSLSGPTQKYALIQNMLAVSAAMGKSSILSLPVRRGRPPRRPGTFANRPPESVVVKSLIRLPESHLEELRGLAKENDTSLGGAVMLLLHERKRGGN